MRATWMIAAVFSVWTVLLSAECRFGPSSPESTITYRFQPTVLPNELLFHVTVEFKAGQDGTGALQVPTQWADEPLHSVMNVHAISKDLSLGPTLDAGIIRFRARPGEEVLIGFDLKKDWSGALVHPKQFHPVLLPEYFEFTGSNAFVAPQLAPESKQTVNFNWEGLPTGWALATSFGTSATSANRCQSFTGKWKSVDQGLYAGGDFRIHPFEIAGRPAVLAIRGSWGFSDDQAASRIAAVVGDVRAFWHDDNFPYFLVTLKPYDQDHGSSDGSAFTNAFWMYVSRLDPLTGLLPQLAHESFHAWNPSRMGPQPLGSEDSTKWFREGPTEYYAELLSFRAGQLTVQQYVDSINKDFGKFPVSNSEYVRGRVIALWLDSTIRRETSGRHSLDDLMYDMVRDSDRPYTLAKIFGEADRYLSAASQRLLRSAVVDHADLPAPENLPGVTICAHPSITKLTTFDPGLDVVHSYASATITGVVPDGSAYRAGLRDGQKLLSISVDNGNPESVAKFRVRTAEGDRDITYLPRGATVDAWQYAIAVSPDPICSVPVPRP